MSGDWGGARTLWTAAAVVAVALLCAALGGLSSSPRSAKVSPFRLPLESGGGAYHEVMSERAVSHRGVYGCRTNSLIALGRVGARDLNHPARV